MFLWVAKHHVLPGCLSPTCCCTQILRGEEVVCHWLAWQGAVRHWPFLSCFAHIFTMGLKSCTAAYVTERWRCPKWLKHSGVPWQLAEYCFFFLEMLLLSEFELSTWSSELKAVTLLGCAMLCYHVHADLFSLNSQCSTEQPPAW